MIRTRGQLLAAATPLLERAMKTVLAHGFLAGSVGLELGYGDGRVVRRESHLGAGIAHEANLMPVLTRLIREMHPELVAVTSVTVFLGRGASSSDGVAASVGSAGRRERVRPVKAAGAHGRKVLAEGAMGVGTPRILIVDDEPVVLDLVRTVLEEAGYEAVVRSTAHAALAAVGAEGPFDVIVVDLRLPGMDAIGLHRELAQAGHQLAQRMIVMTGDVADTCIDRFVRSTGNRSLQKPFELDALRRAVRETLSSPPRPLAPARG